MSKFFINRPIVAMVISIVTVIVGLAVGWVADHVSVVSSDKAEAKWAARHETRQNR